MLLRKREPSFGTIENPIDALVEHYLYNVPGPCHDNLPRRINYVIKTVRDYRVHGLIYYNRKDACNILQGQAKAIKDRLYRELLVPTLSIEMDRLAEDENDVRAKITSFLDIVGGRI
jgi:benzoyl-CoA reductase/2-hydroxyglutaryl-CoA dehydratase subunit BcrC/BadD/HgdB